MSEGRALLLLSVAVDARVYCGRCGSFRSVVQVSGGKSVRQRVASYSSLEEVVSSSMERSENVSETGLMTVGERRGRMSTVGASK